MVTMAGLNINDAPIAFNAVVLEDLHTTAEDLINKLISKYRSEALRQVHKVLGSADFIGNPVGLWNNITAGVQDVFYEPYQGIKVGEGLQEVGVGFAKGANSLVKKTVFSLSDSFSKVTGSVSKGINLALTSLISGLSMATLDKQFQAKRRTTQARNRPKHAIGGISSGAKAFGTSVLSGVEGLAIKPFEGAEREGVGGFLKGVGKGIAGYLCPTI